MELKLNIYKGLSKTINFGWNLIYGVMTNYSHELQTKAFHTYIVNCWKKSVEIWHVHGVAIIQVQGHSQAGTYQSSGLGHSH